MKKWILFVGLVVAILGILKSAQAVEFVDLVLIDIESFAAGESSTNYYKPETKRCKHDLGGGWFESSVERVCVESISPGTCTPVKCGEPW